MNGSTARSGKDAIAYDADLLRRLQDNDTAAARELADAHLSRAFGLAYRMLGNEAMAEEVAQEAFLRLWKQAGKWKAEAQISTWLHRVVHNLCIDVMRKHKMESDDEVPEDVVEHPHAAPVANPGQELHQARVSETVEVALMKLPERQRTAITLVYHQECSNKEAAEIMGLGVRALESLLARGRRALKEHLDEMKSDLLESY